MNNRGDRERTHEAHVFREGNLPRNHDLCFNKHRRNCDILREEHGFINRQIQHNNQRTTKGVPNSIEGI